jgi:hypothetical protein
VEHRAAGPGQYAGQDAVAAQPRELGHLRRDGRGAPVRGGGAGESRPARQAPRRLGDRGDRRDRAGKAGEATCGVKRQYLGCAGTVANGINTAHLSYVREKTGHALIGAHQQIPREHIDDPVRSLVMGLPPDLAFRSKGQLAIDISTDAAADGIWPDFYCGDEVYGTAPSCASTSKPGARRTYCGCRRTSSSPWPRARS